MKIKTAGLIGLAAALMLGARAAVTGRKPRVRPGQRQYGPRRPDRARGADRSARPKQRI